jgi:hypothetical protein
MNFVFQFHCFLEDQSVQSFHMQLVASTSIQKFFTVGTIPDEAAYGMWSNVQLANAQG